MRAVVYTENNYLELGISGKDSFLKCLPPDEDGKFDTVQTMTPEIMEKIASLTDKDYMMPSSPRSYTDQVTKVMDEVPNGSKFMVTDQWTGQQYMMTAVKKLNEGMTIPEVNAWIKVECNRLRDE